ncbi:MAG: penicillin-binding protein 2 [Chthoniobacterales bacterium]|nr:penicillin-binding protein 2 [Chthoniobacterales bacterium]
MIRRSQEFRIAVLGALALGIFLMLIGRLWYVQVARGAEYTSRIRSTSQVSIRLPAVRGEILDRNGVPLVQNRASNAIEFYFPDIVRDYRNRFGDVPMRTYRTTVGGMMTEKTEADILKIIKDSIIPQLDKLGLAQSFNANALQQHFRNQIEVPFTYMEDLDFDMIARFAEHGVDIAGVNLSVRPVRRYVYGALGSHFLGYVGLPDKVDEEEAMKFDYYQQDTEGKTQLERAFDSELKGTPGARILQRNAKGKIEREVRNDPAKQGHNIILTVDARIQHIAEKAMRAVGRGAAVVIDPNDGDVLAMASVPSFDPNTFIPAISAAAWGELTKDTTDPLLNRAVGAYAPGSTFKVAISLAGLRANLDEKRFNCSGGVQYGDKFMQCWIAAKKGAHGTVDLESAICVSCNAFFYQFGNAAGIEQIDAVGNMLGLGQKSGLPLSGESAGILPGPEWLQAKYPRERWSRGQTANVSIGQGFVLATPLQMAMIAATVANWGTSYYPRIVDKVVAQDGTVVRQEPVRVRANLLENGLTTEKINHVRRGMWDVVNRGGGTASAARIKNYEVAGKTGTAQFWRGGIKDNHTWFIAFAPFDKPRYAVAVLVQGAQSGGGVAAPVAAKILSDVFEMEEGTETKVASLEPAKGSFQFVSSVDFGRPIPAALADAASVDATASESAPEGVVPPTVRQAADAAGTVPQKKQGFFQRLFGGGKKKEKKETAQRPPGR